MADNKRGITISTTLLITLLTTIILGLGSWGLIKLTSLPDAFASKQMVLGIYEQNKKAIDCIEKDYKEENVKLESRIEKRLDRFEDKMSESFNQLHQSLDRYHTNNKNKEVQPIR